MIRRYDATKNLNIHNRGGSKKKKKKNTLTHKYL